METHQTMARESMHEIPKFYCYDTTYARSEMLRTIERLGSIQIAESNGVRWTNRMYLIPKNLIVTP